MRTSFVIDASVIVSWRDPREENSYGLDILRCLSREHAITPIICCMEVNNVLRHFEKRKVIAHDTIQETIDFIAGLPISLDYNPIEFRMPHIMKLSREHDLTIYDACYLELASRLDLPLATMDKKLTEAVKNAGLALKGLPTRSFL
jgi:predicted nucleic acid-binding protein